MSNGKSNTYYFITCRRMCSIHCREDGIGIAAIKAEPTFSVQDKRRERKLYDIAKDMDGLDRVRFNGLDFV